jgi:hypothetical protein
MNNTIARIIEVLTHTSMGPIDWATNIIDRYVDSLYNSILEDLLEDIIEQVFSAGAPDNVYSFDFTEGPDPDSLWSVVWDLFLPIWSVTMLLFAFALGVVFFTNIFRDEKKRKDAIRRLAKGWALSLAWWWIGAWTLKLVDVAVGTLFIVEELASGNGALTNLRTGVGLSALFLMISIFFMMVLIVYVIFIIRMFVLMLYQATMPLILFMWSLPIEQAQSFAEGALDKYIPTLVMPFPAIIVLDFGLAIIVGDQAMFSGPTGALLSLTVAIAVFALAWIAPLAVFFFGSGASRALRTVVISKAAMGGGAAGATAAGAGAGGGGGAANQQLQNSASSSGGSGGSGGGGGGGLDSNAHETSDTSQSQARRRRQQQEREASVEDETDTEEEDPDTESGDSEAPTSSDSSRSDSGSSSGDGSDDGRSKTSFGGEAVATGQRPGSASGNSAGDSTGGDSETENETELGTALSESNSGDSGETEDETTKRRVGDVRSRETYDRNQSEKPGTGGFSSKHRSWDEIRESLGLENSDGSGEVDTADSSVEGGNATTGSSGESTDKSDGSKSLSPKEIVGDDIDDGGQTGPSSKDNNTGHSSSTDDSADTISPNAEVGQSKQSEYEEETAEDIVSKVGTTDEAQNSDSGGSGTTGNNMREPDSNVDIDEDDDHAHDESL